MTRRQLIKSFITSLIILVAAICLPIWQNWLVSLTIKSKYEKEIAYKNLMLEASKCDKKIAEYKLKTAKIEYQTNHLETL